MAYGHDETIRHGLDDSGGNGDELTNYREDEARELLKEREREQNK
jgi:hypothetical protein